MSYNNSYTLSGNELFEIDKNYDYEKISIGYSDVCNTVGVVAKENGGVYQYFVYRTGERGSIDWEYRCETFLKAVDEARVKYKHLLTYLDEIARITREVEEESTLPVLQPHNACMQSSKARFYNGQKVLLVNAYAELSKGETLVVLNNQKVKFRKEYCILVTGVETSVGVKIPTKYLKCIKVKRNIYQQEMLQFRSI